MRRCVLYPSKMCDGCGECDVCDLDPNKICDNCGKCIDYDPSCKFAEIKIDEIITDEEK